MDTKFNALKCENLEMAAIDDTSNLGSSVTLDPKGRVLNNLTPKQSNPLLKLSTTENIPDADELPFSVISYGDTQNSMKLPYNDHNYVGYDDVKGFENYDKKARAYIQKNQHTARPELVNTSNIRISNISSFGMSNYSSQFNKDEPFSPDRVKPVNATPILASRLSQAGTNTIFGARKSVIGPNTIVINPGSLSRVPALNLIKVQRPNTHQDSVDPRIIKLPIKNPPTLTSLISAEPPENYGVFPSDKPTNIIRCICGFSHDDGGMIRCEICRTWQHIVCMYPDKKLSLYYKCEKCEPRELDFKRARLTQTSYLMKSNNQDNANDSVNSINNEGGNNKLLDYDPALCAEKVVTNTSQSHYLLMQDNATKTTISTTNNSNNTASSVYINSSSVSHLVPPGSPRTSKRKQDLISFTQQLSKPNQVSLMATSNCNSILSESSSANTPNNNTHACGGTSIPKLSTSTISPANSQALVSSSLADNHSTTASSVSHSYRINSATTNGSSYHPSFQSFSHSSSNNTITNSTNTNSICSSTPVNMGHSIQYFSNILDNNSSSNININAVPNNNNNSNSNNSATTTTTTTSTTNTCNNNTNINNKISNKLKKLLENIIVPHTNLSIHQLQFLKQYNFKICNSGFDVVRVNYDKHAIKATEEFTSTEVIMEYNGNIVLHDEIEDEFDFRNQYNPYLLFYNKFNQLSITINTQDSNSYAMYLRRSCTPNAEIKHRFNQNNQINFYVVPINNISKDSEITIGFGFDFTECAFSVDCACNSLSCQVKMGKSLGLSCHHGRRSDSLMFDDDDDELEDVPINNSNLSNASIKSFYDMDDNEFSQNTKTAVSKIQSIKKEYKKRGRSNKLVSSDSTRVKHDTISHENSRVYKDNYLSDYSQKFLSNTASSTIRRSRRGRPPLNRSNGIQRSDLGNGATLVTTRKAAAAKSKKSQDYAISNIASPSPILDLDKELGYDDLEDPYHKLHHNNDDQDDDYMEHNNQNIAPFHDSDDLEMTDRYKSSRNSNSNNRKLPNDTWNKLSKTKPLEMKSNYKNFKRISANQSTAKAHRTLMKIKQKSQQHMNTKQTKRKVGRPLKHRDKPQKLSSFNKSSHNHSAKSSHDTSEMGSNLSDLSTDHNFCKDLETEDYLKMQNSSASDSRNQDALMKDEGKYWLEEINKKIEKQEMKETNRTKYKNKRPRRNRERELDFENSDANDHDNCLLDDCIGKEETDNNVDEMADGDYDYEESISKSKRGHVKTSKKSKKSLKTNSADYILSYRASNIDDVKSDLMKITALFKDSDDDDDDDSEGEDEDDHDYGSNTAELEGQCVSDDDKKTRMPETTVISKPKDIGKKGHNEKAARKADNDGDDDYNDSDYVLDDTKSRNSSKRNKNKKPKMGKGKVKEKPKCNTRQYVPTAVTTDNELKSPSSHTDLETPLSPILTTGTTTTSINPASSLRKSRKDARKSQDIVAVSTNVPGVATKRASVVSREERWVNAMWQRILQNEKCDSALPNPSNNNNTNNNSSNNALSSGTVTSSNSSGNTQHRHSKHRKRNRSSFNEETSDSVKYESSDASDSPNKHLSLQITNTNTNTPNFPRSNKRKSHIFNGKDNSSGPDDEVKYAASNNDFNDCGGGVCAPTNANNVTLSVTNYEVKSEHSLDYKLTASSPHFTDTIKPTVSSDMIKKSGPPPPLPAAPQSNGLDQCELIVYKDRVSNPLEKLSRENSQPFYQNDSSNNNNVAANTSVSGNNSLISSPVAGDKYPHGKKKWLREALLEENLINNHTEGDNVAEKSDTAALSVAPSSLADSSEDFKKEQIETCIVSTTVATLDHHHNDVIIDSSCLTDTCNDLCTTTATTIITTSSTTTTTSSPIKAVVSADPVEEKLAKIESSSKRSFLPPVLNINDNNSTQDSNYAHKSSLIPATLPTAAINPKKRLLNQFSMHDYQFSNSCFHPNEKYSEPEQSKTRLTLSEYRKRRFIEQPAISAPLFKSTESSSINNNNTSAQISVWQEAARKKTSSSDTNSEASEDNQHQLDGYNEEVVEKNGTINTCVDEQATTRMYVDALQQLTSITDPPHRHYQDPNHDHHNQFNIQATCISSNNNTECPNTTSKATATATLNVDSHTELLASYLNTLNKLDIPNRLDPRISRHISVLDNLTAPSLSSQQHKQSYNDYPNTTNTNISGPRTPSDSQEADNHQHQHEDDVSSHQQHPQQLYSVVTEPVSSQHLNEKSDNFDLSSLHSFVSHPSPTSDSSSYFDPEKTVTFPSQQQSNKQHIDPVVASTTTTSSPKLAPSNITQDWFTEHTKSTNQHQQQQQLHKLATKKLARYSSSGSYHDDGDDWTESPWLIGKMVGLSEPDMLWPVDEFYTDIDNVNQLMARNKMELECLMLSQRKRDETIRQFQEIRQLDRERSKLEHKVRYMQRKHQNKHTANNNQISSHYSVPNTARDDSNDLQKPQVVSNALKDEKAMKTFNFHLSTINDKLVQRINQLKNVTNPPTATTAAPDNTNPSSLGSLSPQIPSYKKEPSHTHTHHIHSHHYVPLSDTSTHTSNKLEPATTTNFIP